MRRPRPAALLAALLAATTMAVTACGGDDTTAGAGSVPGSEPFNDADVAFATEMIPHHAQALMMVDLATTRRTSPELGALLEQIRAARAPEFEQMTDWLTEWDQPVPENPRDHANAGHGEMPDMEGMEGVDDLVGMRGAAFEEHWLHLMIEHHEGAITLAEQEVADGELADAVDLAEEVAAAQREEIDQMESMLR